MIRGVDTEFNKLVHRSSCALPPEELKLKVIKVKYLRSEL